jgi:LDH2 family malate/lactate/ureidoglycolate dehydrogenase
MPLSEFEQLLYQMSQEARAQQKVDKNKKVMVPNDPQIQFQKERGEKGIPLTNELYELIFMG